MNCYTLLKALILFYGRIPKTVCHDLIYLIIYFSLKIRAFITYNKAGNLLTESDSPAKKQNKQEVKRMEGAALNSGGYGMPGLEGYRKIERINGVTYDMSPSAAAGHGIVNGNIFSIIKNALKDSVCNVFIENLDLRISEDEWLIPDIMVVCDMNDVEKGVYKGVPRFVVETLSPSTAKRDRVEKMEKYESIGVPEFWLVGYTGKTLEIYYLKDGKYVLEETYILESDPGDEDYNADTEIRLRMLPHVRMTLGEIFEDVDWGSSH